MPFTLEKCDTKLESKSRVKTGLYVRVIWGCQKSGNSEKPLVKRLGPVYKSPTFAFACSWWSGVPTASFQVKTEMKTASFHLGFISDLPHFSISFRPVFDQFLNRERHYCNLFY